jgi:hypothetical protein
MLHLAGEEVSLWSPVAGPRPSSLVVAKDHIITAQCEGTVMARMENPLRVENGLVEPNPQAHPPAGIYVARTLVQDRQEVPVRVLNATLQDQELTRGSTLAQCEPVMLVTMPDVEQTRAKVPRSRLEDIIAEAKPHLSKKKFHELGELLTEYKDIFTGNNKNYGRTNKVLSPYRYR